METMKERSMFLWIWRSAESSLTQTFLKGPQALLKSYAFFVW